MHTASVMSRASMVSSVMQSMQTTKPIITISLKGEDESTGDCEETRIRTMSFTTMDKIEGEVSFVAPIDTRFDDIYIGLEG